MKNLSKFLAFLSVFAVVGTTAALVVFAAPPAPVTICHATGSGSYNTIHTNENAISGHFENNGTPKAGHEDDLLFEGTVECPGDDPEPGVITIVKVIEGETDATPDDFSFQINGGAVVAFESDGSNDVELSLSGSPYTVVEVEADGFDVSYDGCFTFSDIENDVGNDGLWEIFEVLQDGWEFESVSCEPDVIEGEIFYPEGRVGINVLIGDDVTCIFTNTVVVEPPSEDATISLTKIVCPEESDLPNWAGEDMIIDANTASDFLNENPQCNLEPDWQFQIRYWGPDNVANDDDPNTLDPGGSFIGEAVSPWETIIGATDSNGVLTTTFDTDDV